MPETACCDLHNPVVCESNDPGVAEACCSHCPTCPTHERTPSPMSTETPETAPRPLPRAAAERAYAAGHATWYMSSGEKIEFTAEGFTAWYRAEVALVRATVAEEILDEVCAPAEQCEDRFCIDCIRHTQQQRDAEIARGERP